MTESEKDAQARWIIKQDLPVCVCAPTNPKHREGWQCVTPSQLTEWAKHEPCYFTNPNDRKRAAWLWLWFSQHPKAKSMTGRDEEDAKYEARLRDQDRARDLGLDTWDDAAGMSELEKGMFP